MPNLLVTALNAGELSPYMDARTDVEKYRTGCRRLENMIVLPYGGVYRRAGTEYLGEAKLSDKRCRLIAFNFSVTTRFVLEFGDLYLRVWGNNSIVLHPAGSAWVTSTAYAAGDIVTNGGVTYYCVTAHTSGTFATNLAAGLWYAQPANGALEIPTPYTEAQLRELQYAQVNDVMYLTHANHAPRKLTRVSNTNWTLAAVQFAYPPLLDINASTTTIASSAASGAATLTASASTFQSGHVGSQWAIQWPRNSGSLNETIDANKTSTATLDIQGDWTITTVGTWIGTVRILRIPRTAMDANGGSGFTAYEVVREFNSLTTARNFTATGTETERVGLKLQIANYASNTNARVFLESTDFNSGGTVTINSVASGTSAGATVNKWLGSTITGTTQWSEAAFSAVRGYPRTVTFYQQRLVFGGTLHQPNTVWASRVDDFENFQLGTKEDDSVSFTIASNEGNRINWMFAQRGLIVGTSGDEWTVSGATDGDPFSAVNISARRQASYGSKYMRAVLLNDVLLFVQRRGRKVRELTYSFEKDGWLAPDLTVLAEHVTESEIVEIAFQQQPDAILWGVRGDGQMVGMSYERDQQVVAWHRHTTDGEFESVATVYGLNNDDDEVWLSVKRTIGGQTKRFIERFKPDNRAKFDAEAKDDWWYLDAAARYEGTPANVISGLSHLEGKTVSVLADGAAQPAAVVASGQITLGKPASTVLVGLPYVSLIQPMKFDFQTQSGPTRGLNKRINRITVSLFKSLGGEASTDGLDYYWIYPRDFDDPMDASPPVFSGDAEVVLAGNYSQNADIYLRQILPYPFTVRALVIKLDAFGD
jgi:hypothetical protein